MRRLIRIVPICLGVGLLAALLWKVGPGRLLRNIEAVGWGLVAPVAIGGLCQAVRTLAWRLTLPRNRPTFPFWRLMGLRLVGEAGGQFGLTGRLAGESTRIWLMSPVVPVAAGISSVALDRGMYAIGGAIFAVFGVALALTTERLPQALVPLFGVLAIGLAAFVGSVAVGLRRGWPLLSGPLRVLRRYGIASRSTDGWMEAVLRVERTLLGFHCDSPAAFWCSFGLQLMGHWFAVAEVYAILWLLGTEPSVLLAFLTEALTKIVNIAGSFVPANIGTYEGGNMFILSAFGLAGSTGLTLAVVRRVRALFWSALGLVYLAALRLPSRAAMAQGRLS